MLIIDAVESTVLFAEGEDGLLQMVNMAIENTSEAVDASIDVSASGSMLLRDSVIRIEAGKGKYTIHIPDIRDPVSGVYSESQRGSAGSTLCGLEAQKALEGIYDSHISP